MDSFENPTPKARKFLKLFFCVCVCGFLFGVPKNICLFNRLLFLMLVLLEGTLCMMQWDLDSFWEPR